MASLKRTNEEKEQKINILEEAKTAFQNETGELRTNLREVEKSRLDARRELQELRRQVREGDCKQLKRGKNCKYWKSKHWGFKRLKMRES